MPKRMDATTLRTYRDAVGIILAAYRKDDKGADELIAGTRSKAQLIAALAAIADILMREIDKHGGDAQTLVQSWAYNVARWEGQAE